MPMISFSLPPMLPFIVRGLREAGASFAEPFEGWYDNFLKHRPDICKIEQISVPARVKRQTIRARHDGRRSSWATAKAGDPLYIWWKQRVAGERFFIGTVPLKVVWMVSYGPANQFWRESGEGNRFAMAPAEEPWFEDGFDDLQAFRSYFGPEAAKGANGVFSGWEIHW